MPIKLPLGHFSFPLIANRDFQLLTHHTYLINLSSSAYIIYIGNSSYREVGIMKAMDCKTKSVRTKATAKPKNKVKVRDKNDYSDSLESKIRDVLKNYIDANAGTYYVYQASPQSYMLLKKVEKNIKHTHDKHIFMVFERSVKEEFVVPIIVYIMKNNEKYSFLEDFGVKAVVLKTPIEVEWKLNEIV